MTEIRGSSKLPVQSLSSNFIHPILGVAEVHTLAVIRKSEIAILGTKLITVPDVVRLGLLAGEQTDSYCA
jgi:hypothetical protein